MNYTLPECVEVGGREYSIMWDYRPILDIMQALSAPELEPEDRVWAAMYIFYPNLEEIPLEGIQEAAEKMMWFINGGDEDTGRPGPKLMDWEQDFRYIVAPVSRVIGYDVRKPDPLHWWSFLSAYMEVGDCTFAQVVRIRDRKARGKMDKQDREWYNRNREIVDFKSKYTQADDDRLKDFLGG